MAYNGIQGYARGADAPLVVRIFNSGTTPVVLTKVTTDKAEQVVLLGGATQPPTTTPPPPPPSASASPSASGRPAAGASASVTITQSPTQAAGQSAFAITIAPGGYVLLVPGKGQYLALRGLKEPLTPGFVTNVSFTFDNGATTTVGVPFGPPTEAGPRASAEYGGAEE